MTDDTPALRARPQLRTGRRALVAGLLIAGALGFLLWRGLGDATVYFKTADEAVAQRQRLGTRRFRIEGAVLAGSVKPRGGAVDFTIEENGAEVDVVHRGDPPELFQDGIPVVLEGHFQGRHFESDRIMVKHSSQYRAKNPSRVKDYPPGGDRP